MTALKFIVASTLVALPMTLAACSETVYHDDQTHRNLDGTVSHTDKTIEKNPDGTTTVTEDKVNR